MFLVAGHEKDANSRFLEIPIPVGAAGLIDEDTKTLFQFLGWFVGPAFTAPWILWLVNRWRSRDQPPQRIIVP